MNCFAYILSQAVFNGIERENGGLINDTVALCILLALCGGILIWTRLFQGRGKSLNKLDGYISGQRNFSLEWDLSAAYFAFLGLCGYSLFFTTCFSGAGNYSGLWKTAAAISAFFLAKLAITHLYTKTFFKNSRSSATRIQTLYFASGGISALAAFLLSNYSPFDLDSAYIALFCIFQAALAIGAFAITYIKFFATARLGFEYILYLCTLEVLPMIVLLQMLKRILIFTH